MFLSSQRAGLGECNIPWSLDPANHNWAIDKQYPIKSNEQKKKEPFRYLFVFLTIYFKYFEGEFWWAKGLRVREECYARASRRVTIESRL